MIDDFMLRAIAAGVGVAMMAGPLGCFIVWRRMAYFGDTMAHSALLGIAFAFLFEVEPMLGVFAVAALVALALLLLQRRPGLSTDALLGILAHATLALGLVMVAAMPWARVDLTALLFGDILAVSDRDILAVYLGGAVVLAGLAKLWRPLLAATVSPELAGAEGLRPDRARALFMLLMAGVIALAMKLVGVLLITALLIIPAATARRFAATPEAMAVIAAGLGVMAVTLGLFGSLEADTPSGPTIVVAAMLIFLLSLLIRREGADDGGGRT